MARASKYLFLPIFLEWVLNWRRTRSPPKRCAIEIIGYVIMLHLVGYLKIKKAPYSLLVVVHGLFYNRRCAKSEV